MADDETRGGDEAGKLFVGGLSWETTKDSLSEYFGQYGKIIDSVVMMDSASGKSRGFGFVTFEDPRCAEEALKESAHILDSKTIDPKPCNPKTALKQKLKQQNNNTKIFLGGLPANITESDLRNFFDNYGTVTEVTIMYDATTHKSRGFGFLTFESAESVEKAVSNHYVFIKGKQVEIKMAEKNRQGGGGGGGMNAGNGMQGLGAMFGGPMGQMGGGPMGGNVMQPNGGYSQGWGGNQQANSYNPGQYNQGPRYQNPNPYGPYSNSQQPYGQQGFNNFGGGNNPGGNYGFGAYGGPNGPQGGNQGGQGYMGNGSGMGGPNQMGVPNQMSGPNQMGGQSGNYNNNQSGYNNMDNMSGGQNDGPPGGRGGAQQNTGYHPYRRDNSHDGNIRII